mmetsp:Transcript_11574/g.32946  ORF Transcript_11574/g.32946 Transcript_11574/m.32946 type:complete len:229 (+) Transcript_11574:1046-1732(+)
MGRGTGKVADVDNGVQGVCYRLHPRHHRRPGPGNGPPHLVAEPKVQQLRDSDDIGELRLGCHRHRFRHHEVVACCHGSRSRCGPRCLHCPLGSAHVPRVVHIGGLSTVPRHAHRLLHRAGPVVEFLGRQHPRRLPVRCPRLPADDLLCPSPPHRPGHPGNAGRALHPVLRQPPSDHQLRLLGLLQPLLDRVPHADHRLRHGRHGDGGRLHLSGQPLRPIRRGRPRAGL